MKKSLDDIEEIKAKFGTLVEKIIDGSLSSLEVKSEVDTIKACYENYISGQQIKIKRDK